MEISVSEAKGRLTELAHLAENGEEVVLTRHGKPVVALAPVDWEGGGRFRRFTAVDGRSVRVRDIAVQAVAEIEGGGARLTLRHGTQIEVADSVEAVVAALTSAGGG